MLHADWPLAADAALVTVGGLDRPLGVRTAGHACECGRGCRSVLAVCGSEIDLATKKVCTQYSAVLGTLHSTPVSSFNSINCGLLANHMKDLLHCDSLMPVRGCTRNVNK